MKGRLIYTVLAILVLCRVHVHSFENYNTTVVSISPFSKGAAVGGANSALCEGVESMYYNPAGLVYGRKHEFNFTHMQWLGDTFFNNAAVKTSWNDRYAFGLSFFGFGSGSIEGIDSGSLSMDSDGYYMGTGSAFKANNISLLLSGAYNFRFADKISIPMGMSIKTSFAGVSDIRVNSFGVDLGFMFPLMGNFPKINPRFSAFVPANISMTFQNIGFGKVGGSSSKARANDIDFQAGFGFNAITNHHVYNLMYELDFTTRDIFMMGMVNRFLLPKNVSIDAMTGMRIINQRPQVDFGISVNMDYGKSSYSIGYAMATFHDLGLTHYISFELKSDIDIFKRRPRTNEEPLLGAETNVRPEIEPTNIIVEAAPPTNEIDQIIEKELKEETKEEDMQQALNDYYEKNPEEEIVDVDLSWMNELENDTVTLQELETKSEREIELYEGERYFKAAIDFYKAKSYQNSILTFHKAMSLNYKVPECESYINIIKGILDKLDKDRNKQLLAMFEKSFNRALKYYAQEDYENAVANLNEALELYPSNALALRYFNIISEQMKFDGERVIDMTSPYAQYFNSRKKLGEEFMLEGNFAEAKKLWEEILDLFPHNEHAKDQMAICSSRLNPEEFKALVDANFEKAMDFYKSHNLKSAHTQFKYVRKLNPKYPDIDAWIKKSIPPVPPPVIIERGELQIIKKSDNPPFELKAELEKALKLFQTKDFRKAKDIYRGILVYYPDNATATLNLTRIENELKNQGKKGTADNLMKSRQRQLAENYYLKGKFYFRIKNYEKAIDYWTRAYKADPSFKKALIDIKRVKALMGK